MKEEQIKAHARKYWERTNKKYYSWKEGFRLESELCPIYGKSPREWLNSEEKESQYALKILEKKRLLSQETRKNLYKLIGDAYLSDRIFSEARKYYLFAGRQDLLGKIETERKKAIEWCRKREEYIAKAEESHRLFEESMSDPENFKNN